MKQIIKKEVEVDIKTLHVKAGVRYWEDGTLNGVEDEDGEMPCRKGDYWEPIIDIETGVITNWTQGIKADIHYKVCDDGTYTLKDEKGVNVHTNDGYVPNIMCPVERGYGDYIIMTVDENGKIGDWPKNPDISDFFDAD